MAGRTALVLVAALALGPASADAQTPSLPIPVRVETLVSAKVGEPREFWVSLPDRYNASIERYPVLYMMDGDFNFNSGVIGGVRQAASLGEIPEFIIVGIKNTNRSKDIFPEEVTYPDGSKDGGRADQYLDFVRDELIPRVTKTYRTTDYRILYGTSNTGFTAVHALFRNPDLAAAYIAASATLSVPSFRSARDNLVGSFTGGRRALVLVMGEYDFPTVVSQNGALKETIGLRAPAGLTCRLRVIENGEHVPPDALVEGLRVLFQGWKITRPLTESSFAEIRAQVDGRLEKFGVPGRIDEDALKGLGNSLLGDKKFAKAIDVLEYRATSYPQSAEAQVGLGDAHRQSGNLEKARACYKRALVIAPGHAAATARLKELATQPTDLPAHTYVIQGKPSEVVQRHEAVLTLARQVETNLKADIETAGNGDKATLTRMYSSLMAIAMVKGDRAAARRYVELVRALQDNPAVKLLTGVITIPYMQAMETPGPDFRATYRTLLSTRLASLPFEDVQATLGAMKRSQESASKAQVIGAVAAGVDPAVKDGQLSQPIAEALVGAAMNLEVILPLKEDVVACIESLFDAVKAPRTTATAPGAASQPAVGTFKTGLKGLYFGQALPGDTPVPFAPEILTSISAWVEATAFSPDGTQFFVSVGAPDYSGATLYYSTRMNGEWTPIVEAPFVWGFTYSNEPVLLADGKTLMFTGKKSTGSLDLWTVGYGDNRWGTPVALPSPINSDAVEYRGSYMSDGTLYFTSGRSGVNQIYRARTDATRARDVDLVAAPVSTGSPEGDPCIGPDGRFLVFNSARDWKSSDLFVSFPDARGGWGAPVKLGAEFNSPDDEYGAHLSPDGRYLFFTRHTSQGNTIYWVAVSAIEKLGRSRETFAGYLDQAPPGQTPRVFTLPTHEGYFASDRIALSADGKELYYTEVTSTWSDYAIRYYKYSDGKWNGPVDLFSGFLGPAFSVDGKTMFFEKYNDSRTCWHSIRSDTGWSTPTLCTELPDAKDKHYLRDTASGRIYASSRGALNGIGQMDISTTVKTDAGGGWHSLGRPLNSPGNEGDFYVARDESFIVFGSPHRGGFGGGDLFISFRESDGSWSDPKNLGAAINTPGFEFGPYVTDDKRYLFFSRSSDFSRVDIYWVRFDSLLETLRTR